MKRNTAFTTKEVNLLANKNLFAAKARIIQKLSKELLLLEELYVEEVSTKKETLSEEILKNRGKITKGENLNNLPWMVLDYPRLFNRKNIFAIRTLVWWGKHISVSLVVSGNFKKLYEERVFKELNSAKFNALYICISNTAWEHDFTKENYCKTSQLSKKIIDGIKERNFLKISFKIHVKEINELQSKALTKFKLLLRLLHNN